MVVFAGPARVIENKYGSVSDLLGSSLGPSASSSAESNTGLLDSNITSAQSPQNISRANAGTATSALHVLVANAGSSDCCGET